MFGTWAKHVCHSEQAQYCIHAHYNTVPAVAMGIVLGPIGSKFLDMDRWVDKSQQAMATLGVMRLMIGIQL